MIYLYLFGTCFHFIYVFMIIGKYQTCRAGNGRKPEHDTDGSGTDATDRKSKSGTYGEDDERCKCFSTRRNNTTGSLNGSFGNNTGFSLLKARIFLCNPVWFLCLIANIYAY